MLHRLAEAEVDAEGQRRDEFREADARLAGATGLAGTTGTISHQQSVEDEAFASCAQASRVVTVSPPSSFRPGGTREQHRNEATTMSLRASFFAMTYDRFMAKAEKSGLGALRQRVLAGAAGQVIEIGGGTGANLSLYGPAVESLTVT